jgi:mercuric ion transport protein
MEATPNLEAPPTGETRPPASALALAGLAALLASSCCVLPLALALAGISGAWISQLRVMEPYSDGLLALAVGALAWAAWRIYGRSAQAETVCETDPVCRPVSHTVRTWFWLVLVITLVPLLVPLAAPWFY